MKHVQADWELRNLGISVSEFDISEDDTLETVLSAVSASKSQMLVVRVPTGSPELLRALQLVQFQFVETMIHLVNDLKKLHDLAGIPKNFRKLRDLRATEVDMELIFSAISAGLFKHDRISRDGQFTKNQAATRMGNWIRDEISRGAEVRIVESRGYKVGFYTWRLAQDNSPIVALSGVLDSNPHPGAGYLLNLGILNWAFNSGAKRLAYRISSNNQAALRIAVSLGFQVSDCKYILTRNSIHKTP